MKTKIKKQWTQIVAVAAAAACAVSATVAGVSINHADAASGDIAYLYTVDDNWALNTSNNSFDNSVVMTGDGTYSVTITNNNTYAASSWTPTETDWGGMIGVIQLVLQNVTTEEVTIDSLVFPNKTFENVEYTRATNQYREFVDDAGTKSYLSSAVLTLDNAVFAGQSVGIGESITVNFTIGDAGTAATTTTTEKAAVTTTTTKKAAVTTTTSASKDSDTTTTTVKAATTTKATTTTKAATTTKTTTAPNYDKEITNLSKQTEKGDDGNINAYVEFDPDGAKSATLVYKILSDDTNTSGAFGTWNGTKWLESKWEDVAVPTDKLITREYTFPSDVGDTVKASIYWPGQANVQFVSVTLHYDSDPNVTTTTSKLESDLTFEKVSIGKASNKIDMLDRCYIIETIKATPGYTVSGGMYSGEKTDTYYTSDSWEETVGDSQLIVREYKMRGAYDASYGIFYYGKGTEEKSSVEVNIQTFYTGDASLNGKVNGSDVLAIVNYIKGSDKTNLEDAVCDFDASDSVSLADVVALTKALIGSGKTQSMSLS